MPSRNLEATPAAFAPEEGVTLTAVKPALRLVREKIVTTIRAEAMTSGMVFEGTTSNSHAPRSEPANVMAISNHNRFLGSRSPLRKGKGATDKQNRVNYDRFETAVLRYFSREDWKAVAGESESDEFKLAKSELETVLHKIDETSHRIQRMSEAMEDPDANFAILSREIGKAESALAGLVEQKDALQANVDSARAKCDTLHNPETLVRLINSNAPESNDIRLRLRAEIRKRITGIDLIFRPESVMAMIRYTNGAGRVMQIDLKSGASRAFHVRGNHE
jgi:hypothetical protein